MINLILQYPLFYRLYQKMVRKKNHEYDFFKYIFSEISKTKKIKMLDLCSGDSFVLNYVDEYVDEYIGVDNNEKYLKKLKDKWPKFTFLNMDISNLENANIIRDFNPNLIFMNGAIHHLDNTTMDSINSFLDKYKESVFLSVDPIKENNKLLNKIMIFFDRGKFIRNKKNYHELMNSYQYCIIDDFYRMSFQNMFHFKNLNLINLYKNWKNYKA
jgi:hypothetical protein